MNCLCSNEIHPERWKINYRTCLECGDMLATKARESWCIAPMHKSNYMLITNPNDLQGINNKGGLIR